MFFVCRLHAISIVCFCQQGKFQNSDVNEITCHPTANSLLEQLIIAANIVEKVFIFLIMLDWSLSWYSVRKGLMTAFSLEFFTAILEAVSMTKAFAALKSSAHKSSCNRDLAQEKQRPRNKKTALEKNR